MGALIGAFSQLLETSSDGAVVGLCLKGFQSAVRVAAATDLDTAREYLLNALTRFDAAHGARDAAEHVAGVKALLQVALRDGDTSATRGCTSCSARRSSRACVISSGLGATASSARTATAPPPARAAPRRPARIFGDAPAAAAEAARALDEGNAAALAAQIDARWSTASSPRRSRSRRRASRPSVSALVQVSHAEIFDPVADDAGAAKANGAGGGGGGGRRPPGGRA